MLEFTLISALLSLAGVVLAFTVSPTSPLPFVLLLTPLYINTHSYGLGVALIVGSLAWPSSPQETHFVVRVSLILNAMYLMGSNNRKERYRMMPAKILNEGVPILL